MTVRGCVPRASLRRIPKEVADCLKFVVLFTCTERASNLKLYRLAARRRARQLTCVSVAHILAYTLATGQDVARRL
jgi:hypothetical protein